jgi:predicted metal-dependent hydrolase
MTPESLEIGGLIFAIRRNPRRRTLGLIVDRTGALLIQAPQSAQNGELTEWTKQKLLWVYQKLSLQEHHNQRSKPDFVTGEGFFYLGQSHRLKVVKDCVESFGVERGRFILRYDQRARACELFRAWYIKSGRQWVWDRARTLTHRTGVSPSRVQVRELGYRWGSCGKNRVLSFNWRLFQLPVRLIDYVVAHELIHLKEPRHDNKFWNAMDRAMPDWRERKDDLQARAKEYLVFGLSSP